MIEQCSSPGISLSIGEPVISVLPRILEQHKVDPLRLLVASGPGPTRLFASRLVSTNGVCSGAPRHEVKTNDLSSVDELGSFCARQGIETLIALGGGRVIDVCKFASRHRALSVIAIPTALSSDCVASPVAVIRINGISHSLPAKIPAAVIIDTELIGRSPLRTTLAGVGDLLSNLSAILDWQLAVEVEGETWDEYANKLARQAAEEILFINADELFKPHGIKKLAEGLVMSGTAMGVAGNSRPCSGAEHVISHAIDYFRFGRGLHGEQVALGVLYVQALREENGLPVLPEQAIKMIRLWLPNGPEEIGISRDQFLEAVYFAPKTRPGRYTILSQCRSRESLHHVYELAFNSERPARSMVQHTSF